MPTPVVAFAFLRYLAKDGRLNGGFVRGLGLSGYTASSRFSAFSSTIVISVW